MAFTLVNHISGTSDSNAQTATSPVDMTLNGGADLLVAVVAANGGTVQAITDTSGNVWQQAFTFNSAFNRNTFYYCLAPTVSSSMQFTATGQTYTSICVAGFHGVDTVSGYDLHTSSSGAPTTGTISSGSITPLVDNELIITVCGNYQSIGTVSADHGAFTILDEVSASGGHYQGSGMAYQIQTTATEITATWNVTTQSTNTAAAAIISFKAAAAGGSVYSVSVTESGTLADSPAMTGTYGISVTESGTLLDAPTPTVNMTLSISESGTMADSETTSSFSTYNDSVGETGSASDTVSASVVWATTISESGTLSDSESTTTTFTASVSEVGNATDSFPVTAVMGVSVSENGLMLDTNTIPGQGGSTVHGRRFLADVGEMTVR